MPSHMPKKDRATKPALLKHGSLKLPEVIVQGYSLELHQGEDFLGDTVSKSAFSDMVDRWRKVFTGIHGKDPLGTKPTTELSKKRLDAFYAKGGVAAAVIHSACEDYAFQLSHVVQRFLRHKSWRGVKRIVVGGGFKQSAVGEQAIRRAAELLFLEGIDVQMRLLRHHSDEGGLIGWVHLAPPKMLKHYDALLAVDIGGTNVRCGIVRINPKKDPDLSDFQVQGRAKWGHAEDEDATRRASIVQGIADMLKKLISRAKKEKIALAPFVGVACPGWIQEDGSITKGAQNLPGNWESPNFLVAQQLSELLPKIDGQQTQVHLHNDAVVQGLSELPAMTDVKRWATITVGTGLGNASYKNR